MVAPGQPAAASNDRTTLWGVLGIIGAFCCWPAGLVFAILGYMEAKKHGKSPTLAIVAFVILALSLVLNIVITTSYFLT